MGLEARLAEFKELSQKDQAGCLNAVADREARLRIADYIFGDDGWAGEITPGGTFITSLVAAAVKAHSKAPVSNRKD